MLAKMISEKNDLENVVILAQKLHSMIYPSQIKCALQLLICLNWF